MYIWHKRGKNKNHYSPHASNRWITSFYIIRSSSMYIIFLNYVISVVKQKNLLPVTVKWSIDSVVEQNNFSYNQ